MACFASAVTRFAKQECSGFGLRFWVALPIEDIDFPEAQFNVVFSSLAFHYIESFEAICNKVYRCLKAQGAFIFSVEHPIFTSRAEQDWYYDDQGNRLHWPVDNYQNEGFRETSFLTDSVIKYHRTFSTYMNSLINAGFHIKAVKEPTPSEEMLQNVPEMKDEFRRPMFLLFQPRSYKAVKKGLATGRHTATCHSLQPASDAVSQPFINVYLPMMGSGLAPP